MQLEGGETSTSIDSVHDVEPNVRQCLDPSLLVLVNMETDALDDHLVCLLASAVGLRVVSSQHL